MARVDVIAINVASKRRTSAVLHIPISTALLTTKMSGDSHTIWYKVIICQFKLQMYHPTGKRSLIINPLRVFFNNKYLRCEKKFLKNILKLV